MKTTTFNPHVRLLCCEYQALNVWPCGAGGFSAPYWRLYKNDRPGAAVVLNDVETPLHPSHFVLIPPDTPYHGQLSSPVRHFFAHFTAEAPYSRVEPAVFTFFAAQSLTEMVRQIDNELLLHGECTVHVCTLALALVHVALTHVPRDRLTLDMPDERMQAVADMMEKQLEVRIPNEALAEEACMNTNAFIRRFRKAMGHTPQAYHTIKRVEKACMLLHYSGKTIDEISDATGFCDRYHFSRTFKKLRGMGPAAFRRMMERPDDE